MADSLDGKTLHHFFKAAARVNATIDVHIEHPNPDFQRQVGVCYAGEADYLVLGAEGAPERVCIPYAAIRWFRRTDDQI